MMFKEIIFLAVLVSICMVLGGAAFAEFSREQGRIEVASGQYTCELLTIPDKTTKWQCKETEQ